LCYWSFRWQLPPSPWGAAVLAEAALLNPDTQTIAEAADPIPPEETEKIAETTVTAVPTCLYQTHVQNQGWRQTAP